MSLFKSHPRVVPSIGLWACLLLGTLVCQQLRAESQPANEWWQWRGPLATGVAPSAEPPLTWSETENVRWKVPIAGRGHATPIVLGERIYLLTAERLTSSSDADADVSIRYLVLALDRATGKTAWQQTARQESPHEGTHPDGSFASASALTDGEHLFAFFGSRGLYAYDLDGKLLWEIDLGDMTTRRGFGEGASPAVHDDLLIVNWDHEGDSFLVALDKRTGEERWRRTRDEPTSWSTPVVLEIDGKPQVIVSATNHVRGYDLATGADVWQATGMTTNTIPSPVYADGILYVMSGFRGNALLALRLAGAQGDLTGTERIVWTFDQDTPYVPSPVLYDGILYFLKHNGGVLTALDAATGKPHYGPIRVTGVDGVYASLVAAAGKVYIVDRDGKTVVFKAGPEFEILAENELETGCEASPALVGKEIYLRTRSHLYAIGK